MKTALGMQARTHCIRVCGWRGKWHTVVCGCAVRVHPSLTGRQLAHTDADVPCAFTPLSQDGKRQAYSCIYTFVYMRRGRSTSAPRVK